MADEAFNAGDILDNCWRQFSVCQPGDVAELMDGCSRLDGKALAPPDPNDWWIVTSQSCDLTNGNLTKEPFCELLRAVPKAHKKTRFNPDTVWAQNPREIALCNAAGEVLNATIHERGLFPRSRLQGKRPSPDRVLPDLHQYALRKWLAGRYIRPAFPGGFNDRLKPGEKALEAFLAKHESFIRGMYCRITPDDEILVAGQHYMTQWILVYRHAKVAADPGMDLDTLERQAEEHAEMLALRWTKLLTNDPVKDIAAQVDFKPDDRFSLADMDDFCYWDKDFISLQADGGILLPPGVDANP